MTTTPFDPALAKELLEKRIDEHNKIAGPIRLAILDAVYPGNYMTVEEKQDLCQQSPVFRNALAAVAAELVDWSRGEDEFVSLFRDWCCDQTEETGLV